MKRITEVALAMTLVGFSPVLADVPQTWSDAAGTYDVCEKTGGGREKYFESVELVVEDETITFIVQTSQYGTIPTTYQPDGMVRRGNDYHYLEDGTTLGSIPSHEAAFWDDETLVREEITYLPGNVYAMEANRVSIGNNGEVNYVLHVDDELWLSATCM